MLSIVLIDKIINKFTVNASNGKQQSLKIARFQPTLEMSNFRPD